jgi:hypothetical protein
VNKLPITIFDYEESEKIVFAPRAPLECPYAPKYDFRTDFGFGAKNAKVAAGGTKLQFVARKRHK